MALHEFQITTKFEVRLIFHSSSYDTFPVSKLYDFVTFIFDLLTLNLSLTRVTFLLSPCFPGLFGHSNRLEQNRHTDRQTHVVQFTMRFPVDRAT